MAGALEALLHWCFVPRLCQCGAVTTLGPTWATATGYETIEDWVAMRLRSRWGALGEDFDQTGLSIELREAIHNNLPTGWALQGDHFVGPDPIPDDALVIVRATIDEIDFWGMSQSYDQGD